MYGVVGDVAKEQEQPPPVDSSWKMRPDLRSLTLEAVWLTVIYFYTILFKVAMDSAGRSPPRISLSLSLSHSLPLLLEIYVIPWPLMVGMSSHRPKA